MDWKTLFLSADGRIGRRDFWIGFAILFVANMAVSWVPVLGQLFHLASLYMWVCLFSKRLHDMNRSGWLIALPYVIWGIAVVVAFVSGAGALIAGVATGMQGAFNAAALTGLGIAGLALFSAFLFGTLFLLWVGLGGGTQGGNRFGPHPAALVTAF